MPQPLFHRYHTRKHPSVPIMYSPIPHLSVIITALLTTSTLATPLNTLQQRDGAIPKEVSPYLGSDLSVIDTIPLDGLSAGYTLYRATYTVPGQPSRLGGFDAKYALSQVVYRLKEEQGPLMDLVSETGTQKPPVKMEMQNSTEVYLDNIGTAAQDFGEFTIDVAVLANALTMFQDWMDRPENKCEPSLLALVLDTRGFVVANGTLRLDVDS